MHSGPQTSKKPLKARLEKAQRSSKMSARTYYNVTFCERGIKVQEFAAFYRAQSFSEAIRKALEWEPKDPQHSKREQESDKAPQRNVEIPRKERRFPTQNRRLSQPTKPPVSTSQANQCAPHRLTRKSDFRFSEEAGACTPPGSPSDQGVELEGDRKGENEGYTPRIRIKKLHQTSPFGLTLQ